jgi:hypothetical protein
MKKVVLFMAAAIMVAQVAFANDFEKGKRKKGKKKAKTCCSSSHGCSKK